MRAIVAAQILFITAPKARCSKKKQPACQKDKVLFKKCSKSLLPTS
jgi:hypothetical protein